MVPLKVWVRLPTGSPTRLTLVPNGYSSDESSPESIIVDDLRDAILIKYPNALGRLYDTADIQLRLISRPMNGNAGGSSIDEIALGLDDSVIQILNQFYPGGQRATEAFIIHVPELSSSRSSSSWTTMGMSSSAVSNHHHHQQQNLPHLQPHPSQHLHSLPHHSNIHPGMVSRGSPYSPIAMNIGEPAEYFPTTADPQQQQQPQGPVAAAAMASVQSNSLPPATVVSPGLNGLPPSAAHRPRLRQRTSGLAAPGVLLLPSSRRRSSNEVTQPATSTTQQSQQQFISRNGVAVKDGGLYPESAKRPALPHRRTPSLNDPLPTIPQDLKRTSSSESPPVLPTPAQNSDFTELPPLPSDSSENPTEIVVQTPSLPQQHALPRPSTPYADTSQSTAASTAAMLGSATSAAAVLEAVVLQINVLIVEDNIVNQRILEAFMHKRKIFCATAKDGREAVEKWKQGRFHLVLVIMKYSLISNSIQMDIQLPVLSGIEATREIRRLERLNRIGVFPPSTPPDIEIAEPDMTKPILTPNSKDSKLVAAGERAPVIIVALTASSLQSDRHEALAAGCNDFLTKPVSFVWLERKTVEWGCMQALIRFKARLPMSPIHRRTNESQPL